MQRAELVLTRARAFLAICALFAIYLDPTEPSGYAALAYTLLIIYVIYSAAIVVMVRRLEVSRRTAVIFHGFDVVWVSIITLFTSGPNSPFFMFFVFVLMAAAYRWGFRTTMLTALVCMSLFAVEGVALPQIVEGEFELNRLIIRLAYLLIVGLLVGYLAEQQLEHNREIQSTVDILTKVQNQMSLRASLELVMKELMHLFNPREILFAVKENATAKLYLWRFSTAIGLTELASDDERVYLFAAPDNLLMSANRDRNKASEEFSRLHPYGLLLACTNRYEDWIGRVYLLDPQPLRKNAAFFYSLIRQIAPTIYSAYLIHRLRTRAGALARARVAQELHDGIVQAIIGFEMQLEVLRSRTKSGAHASEQDIAHIQHGLRNEVVNLRDLMQQLKPVELDPRQLVEYVAELVDRFRRTTGIGGKFVCEIEETSLSPRSCRDVVRLIQEALMNVRKHSGAQNVLVDLSRRDGSLCLAIQDDGRGFGFEGRLVQEDFDLKRKPPAVIQECVRSMGGHLRITSSGAGARVEVIIPENHG
jgi:signal transduction histidine kinase